MPFAALALVCVSAFLLTACGDSDSSSSGSETTAAEETSGGGGSSVVSDAKTEVEKLVAIPTTIADTGSAFTPKADQSVYLIVCPLELPGCTRFANAVKAATKALGYSLEICDIASTPENGCFTQAAAAKPDGVITQGMSRTEFEAGFIEVEKAKIPIVAATSGNTPGESPGIQAEVNSESCKTQGQDLGKWIIANSNGEAHVTAYYTQTLHCVEQRGVELEKALSACSGCTVDLKPIALDQLQTGLPQQITADLQSNPDTNYVVGGFDAIALIAANAVRETGNSEKVGVLGFDGDEPNLQALEKGEIIVADTLWGFGESGWLSADMLARVIAGETPPQNTDANLMLVEAGNQAEALQGTASWEGPVDYQKQFEALWK
jgi:ribose transport system substrate-binding protein